MQLTVNSTYAVWTALTQDPIWGVKILSLDLTQGLAYCQLQYGCSILDIPRNGFAWLPLSVGVWTEI